MDSNSCLTQSSNSGNLELMIIGSIFDDQLDLDGLLGEVLVGVDDGCDQE